ncbi:MAG: RNA polymerase-associated protein RapA [Nitrospira sp.]|nr:RNA polymerase-associated protein RapA [Nitrospira sp.]
MWPETQNVGGRLYQPGTLVRLRGDPHQFGSYLSVLEQAGRTFAKVQFPGGIRRIPLDQLEPVPAATEEPIDLLRDCRLSTPDRLRQVLTHVRLTGRLADIIYSMEASNTEFHAHQFKPVLKILGSPTDGLLIADEVGLGKTIEAGLIWIELKARFDYTRLLVVCPKVLCSKWRSELTKKFAIDARVVGAGELLELLSDREKSVRGFAAICSLQSLQPPRGWDEEGSATFQRSSSRLARLLRDHSGEEPLVDLLVIDEAHHLRNPETQRNLLGRMLRPIAHHRVFLSATPIQLRNRDLFSLLTLLDPETFRSQTDFDDILIANRPLVAAREAALRGTSLREIASHLDEAASHPLLAGGSQIDAIRSEIGSLGEDFGHADRARLAWRLEQVNLLTSVVNRTRRRDVQELRIVRQVYAHREPMSDAEREVYDRLSRVVLEYALARDINSAFLLATPQRMLSSCLPATVERWRSRSIDFGLEDGEVEDEIEPDVTPLIDRLSRECAKVLDYRELERIDSKFQRFVDVVREYLAEHGNQKIVVFSTFRATLDYLARRLEGAGLEVALIHGSIEDRDTVLSTFETSSSCRILLSSEVGSEGLDLQFCRAIVNYDLPWNPMRIEQRIGRIDRMGQDAPSVSVINLLHAETIDDRIYTRLYERLDLCRHALGEFEAVLGEEVRQLTADLMSGRLSAQEQEQRIEQTAQAVATKRKLVEDLET